MATEPTQEQLSAYVDGELEVSARAELDAHLADCSTCQARLDGLREVVTAIRALPMETPSRTFTVPAQRRQARSWARLGWGIPAMAAVVLTIFWVSHLQVGGGPTATSLNHGTAAGAAYAPMVAPLAAPQLGGASQDSYSAARAAKVALPGQQRTVAVPGQPGRTLTLSTDARSYAMNGRLTIRVVMQGLSSTEVSTIKIYLGGDGFSSVRLAPPASAKTDPLAVDASYAVADMRLPRPGSYSLQVSVELADGSSLVDDLPIAITP